MAPPIGALNIEPMPAPIPTATAILLSSGLNENRSAISDPMPALNCAVGPSLPALPPDPMVIAEAINLISGILLLILPWSLWKAFMAASVPCPSASGAQV